MEVVTAFIDNKTGNEIHNVSCQCADAETVYQPGKEIEIHGTVYDVVHVVRQINGHVAYKVYVNAK